MNTDDLDHTSIFSGCYRPSPWHDLPFNNMISNVPYVGLGLVFIAFVALDEEWWRPDVANGLFYGRDHCVLSFVT